MEINNEKKWIPLTVIFLFMIVFVSGNLFAGGDDARTPSLRQGTTENSSPRAFFKQFRSTGDVDVVIIESQSINSGHSMDTVWQRTAGRLNLSSQIYSQAYLDSLSRVPAQSVLIIASGLIDISDARRDSILTFVRRGGNVYLQAEYTCTYTTNLAFVALVDSLGGMFETEGTVSGQLVPMLVSGGLNSNYNKVDTLDYFWYGCAGSGDSTVTPFLTYNGQHFGYVFTPPDDRYGKIISTTDQDWVRTLASDELMENILYSLYSRATTIREENRPGAPSGFVLRQNYPNPFNPVTTISYDLFIDSKVTLTVYDMTGREIRTLINGQSQVPGAHMVRFESSGLSSGLYLYKLAVDNRQGSFTRTRAMILLK